MKNARSSIKQAHERHQVGLLIDALNTRHRSDFKVISEPEPPEAIIQSRSTTRWVEVVTAFWTDSFAQDLYSYATEGESHRSIGDGIFMNMTPEFAKKFVSVVQAKLQKTTYEQFRDRYGPGYLVVSIQFPFFGKDALDYIEKEWWQNSVHNLGCFRSIYITYRIFHGYKVVKWLPPN